MAKRRNGNLRSSSPRKRRSVTRNRSRGRGAQTRDERRAINSFRPGSSAPFNPMWSHSFPAGSTGFPDRLGITLQYVDQTKTMSSGVPKQVYNMNGCFDPDQTGTGHQPNYYDQLSAIYSKYCVVWADAMVELWSDPGTFPYRAVVLYSDQDISSDTVENLTESQYAKSATIGLSPDHQTVFMPQMWSSQIHGQKIIEPDDNQYAVVGANPSDTWFMIIKTLAVDGSSTFAAYAKVRLRMHVIFKDRFTPTESLNAMQNALDARKKLVALKTKAIQMALGNRSPMR